MSRKLQAHATYEDFIAEVRNSQLNDKNRMVFIEVRANSNLEDAQTPAGQTVKIMRTNSYIHLSALGEDWLTFDALIGTLIQTPATTNEEVQAYQNKIEGIRLGYIANLKRDHEQAKIYRGSTAPVANS